MTEPPDLPIPEGPEPTEPKLDNAVPEDGVEITLSKTLLTQAILDALRLDYQGKLAKVCDQALEEASDDLREYLQTAVLEVAQDPEFKASLQDMIRKKIRDRLGAKVDYHVKRTSAAQLQLILHGDKDPDE